MHPNRSKMSHPFLSAPVQARRAAMPIANSPCAFLPLSRGGIAAYII
jgi:hypothetical protein